MTKRLEESLGQAGISITKWVTLRFKTEEEKAIAYDYASSVRDQVITQGVKRGSYAIHRYRTNDELIEEILRQLRYLHYPQNKEKVDVLVDALTSIRMDMSYTSLKHGYYQELASRGKDGE